MTKQGINMRKTRRDARSQGWVRELLAGVRILLLAAAALALGTQPVHAAAADDRDDASPWGIATGAEWSGDYPRFNPLLRQAGVTWLRYHYVEWGSLQPKPGAWNWERPDAFLDNDRSNGIHAVQCFAYFAPWASVDGGTRRGPVKDMQAWRDYVGATVKRYHRQVKYWEIWNEFNGSFYQGPNKPQAYADLVVAAWEAARKIDPTAQIGLSVASSDIGFLDLAIKAGAAGHFDYICLHPYENLDAMLYGDEPGFLSLGNAARQMLAANRQPVDMPLWLTEGGGTSTVAPDAAADTRQVEALLKFYTGGLAQGFTRIFWFEARGPDYGGGRDFGLIRKDWSLRPAYAAMQTLTTLLGDAPRYLGWLHPAGDAYGFVFQGRKAPVLVAWAPADGEERTTTFAAPVRIVDGAGTETRLAAGAPLRLTRMPVFVLDMPAALVRQARTQAGKPFPWGGDFSQAASVACQLAATNTDRGLRQVFLRPDHEKRSEPAVVDGAACRRMIGTDKDHVCAYFRADPRLFPFGPRPLAVTVVARRAAPDLPAELALTYEAQEGYRDFQTGGESWSIPAGDDWQEHTWSVTNACFANRWGWHIGLIRCGETNAFFVREVRVAKRDR